MATTEIKITEFSANKYFLALQNLKNSISHSWDLWNSAHKLQLNFKSAYDKMQEVIEKIMKDSEGKLNTDQVYIELVKVCQGQEKISFQIERLNHALLKDLKLKGISFSEIAPLVDFEGNDLDPELLPVFVEFNKKQEDIENTETPQLETETKESV